MKSLDTTYYLGHITSRFLFRERALEFQVLAEVTSWAELHYHIEAFLRLKGVLYLHYEGVLNASHLCHDLLFGESILQQVLFMDFIFWQYFHSVKLFGGDFFHQENFSKGTGSEQLVSNEAIGTNFCGIFGSAVAVKSRAS